MSTPSSAALALHRRLITLDGHVDLPLGFGRPGQEADRDGEGQFDLAKVADGRLSAAVLTLFAGQTQRTAKNRAKARDDLETLVRSGELAGALALLRQARADWAAVEPALVDLRDGDRTE